VRSTSCTPASEIEREKMYVGADLDYRAPSADFPPSSPRFHGRSSRLPRRELSLLPLNPLIPLFRSRRFNPGFSTQFGASWRAHCMRVTSATHTFSLILFSLSPPSSACIIYLPSTHTYTVTHPYPESPHLLFPSLSLFLANGDRLSSFTPSFLSSFFLFYSFHSLFSSLFSLSSLFFSLYPTSASLSLSFSFSFNRLSPRFKPSSHPSHAVPRGNTCRRS